MTETQLNLYEGERLKEEGIERANGAARVRTWKERADQWFDNLEIHTWISSDLLILEIGVPDQTKGMNHNNAVGAWFAGKSKAERIQYVQSKKSERPINHAARIAIWRKVK